MILTLHTSVSWNTTVTIRHAPVPSLNLPIGPDLLCAKPLPA